MILAYLSFPFERKLVSGLTQFYLQTSAWKYLRSLAYLTCSWYNC